jgi:hypothetical protein
VQDAPRLRIEGIATVNDTTVVPEQQITVAPLVVPVELWLVNPIPQLI